MASIVGVDFQRSAAQALELSRALAAAAVMQRRSRFVPAKRAVSPSSKRLVVQEVPKFVPVALDLLKAAESFPLCGRKTGNECRSLTPIVDDMPSKYDRDTSSKTDEKNCPEHSATPVQNSLDPRTGRNMLQCGGDIAAHCG
jgi:hypothetical protein